MDRTSRLVELFKHVPPTSRREFLKRSVIMGASASLGGSILAASAGGDAIATSGSPMAPSSSGSWSPTAEETTVAPTGGAIQDAAAGEPRQGGVMVVVGHEVVEGLSPDLAGPIVNSALIAQIHNPLVQMDPWFEFQPVLAESWEISDDGLEYTFTLRDGVTFQDGEPFTAADVKYTYEFYGNPDNAMLSISDYSTVGSVDTPDDRTVVVRLTGPNAAFIGQAPSAFIVPRHVHEQIGEAEYSQAPVGTGSFKLKEADFGAFVELEAYEDHFRGRPHLDGFRLNVVPEPTVRAIALETGEADSSVWALSSEDNIRLRDSGNFWVSISSDTGLNHFPMDHTAPQFQDKIVRQALMHALDRDSMVNDIWLGLAVKATTNLSPSLEFWHDDTDVRQYDYNPELAMQMLDEAGWVAGDDGIRAKDGVRLAWTCAIIAGDQARRPLAEAAQQWFAQIGCQMEIQEQTSVTSSVRDHITEMGLQNWAYGGDGGEPDATGVLHSDYTSERTHYANPEMDRLLEAGLAETDPEARREIYAQVQQLFCEDVPILYNMFWDWFVFMNLRIKGLPEQDLLAGLEIYNLAHTFWIEEA